MRAAISWTGDLGTEAAFSRLSGFNIRDLFPWASDTVEEPECDAEAGGGHGGFDFQAEGRDLVPGACGAVHGDDPMHVSTHGSLFVAGLLHIIHNATEGLSEALVGWKSFVESLRHLTTFLRRPWLRQRLRATCFRTPPASAFLWQFQDFSASIHDGRWGSVVRAVAAVLSLEMPLKLAWDKRRFCFGHQSAAGESVVIDEVDRVITSEYFWTYAKVLDTLAEVIGELMTWSEGCPCHTDDPSLAGPSRHMRIRLFQERSGSATLCPLRGRRAPELAAGQVDRWVSRLLQIAAARVAACVGLNTLPGHERSTVLDDFEQARSHLSFVLQIKLSNWQHIPHLLCGLGHHRHEVAARVAREVLAHHAGGGHEEHPNEQVRALWTGEGLEQLRAFATGGVPLAELPLVHRVAAELRFIPIVERHVEGLHSTMKRTLLGRPRAGVVHTAFMSALPHLRQQLLVDPCAFIEQLSGCCARVRNCVSGVEEMGMARHPSVVYLGGTKRGLRRALMREARTVLVEVIYHVDEDTLFLDHPRVDAWGPEPDEPGDDDDQGPPGPGPPGLPQLVGAEAEPEQRPLVPHPERPVLPDCRTDVQRLWCKEALVFVAELHRGRSATVVYSLGPRLTRPADELAIPLSTLLRPDPQPRQASDIAFAFEQEQRPKQLLADDGSFEVPPEGEEAEHERSAVISTMTFFSLVKSKVGREKVAPLAPNLRAHSGTSSAVRPLRLLSVDLEARVVYVSLEGKGQAAREPLILSLGALSVCDLATLRCWDASICVDSLSASVLSRAPADIADAVPGVVQSMLAAKAVPGATGADYIYIRNAEGDSTSGSVLAALARLGIVTRVRESPGSSAWRLTERGVEPQTGSCTARWRGPCRHDCV